MSFNLVKIHATASTNEELKVRFRESELPQLTTIYTSHQTAGKGQMGARWMTEPHKNLTFSILLTDLVDGLSDFEINKCVTVIVVEWLRQKLQVQAFIKWPNDILSVNHKLAGILLENIFKQGKRRATIVGIGLNVNQLDFDNLPKAISLSQITGKTFDLDDLLIDFMAFFTLKMSEPKILIDNYRSLLFKIDQVTAFKVNNDVFKAEVCGVNDQGLLLLREHDVVQSYDLKELSWIY